MNEIFQLAQLTLAAHHKTDLPALDADAWNALAPRADAQRLSGFLFARLQKHPQRAQIPAPVLKHWQAFYMRQWAMNTRLVQEMLRIHAQWRGEMIFFKGPLLAQRLYGGLDARAISDLDLLLPARKNFSDADAQLRALGYTRVSRALLSPRVSQKFTYHFEYRRGDIPLELHWSVQAHPSFQIDTRALWARRVRVALENRSFETLAPEDELRVALSALPIDLQLNKLTLRALFEIVLLAQGLGDAFAWRDWFLECAQSGMMQVTCAAFDAAAKLFGAKNLPRAVQLQMENARGENRIVANFAPMTAWQRRRAAFALYEFPESASYVWWAFSLGGRMLAHPTETRKTWQRLKSA